MPSSLLPLELSVPFLVPTGVAPVARVCRALRAAALNNATWTEIFARRYPCLAGLPGFDKPADARGLVKSLRRPRLWSDLVPPVPRDAQGRAVSLRSETVLVVQVLRRAEWPAVEKPLIKFVGTFEEILDKSHHETLRLDGNWMFDVDSEPLDDDEESELHEILDLPATIEAYVGDEENFEDATDEIREIIEEFFRRFDRNLQHEVFIVHGDLISRIDKPSATCIEPFSELTMHNNLTMGNVHDFFYANNYPESTEAPWFGVVVEFEINGRMPYFLRFQLGSYHCDTWDATSDESQAFDCYFYTTPSCEILIKWDDAVERNERFEADSGEHSWPWFCQYLAASRPVRFPRVS